MMTKTLQFLLACVLIYSANHVLAVRVLKSELNGDLFSPMIFLPGLMGSIVEGRLANSTEVPPECHGVLTSEYEVEWINLDHLLHMTCYTKMMMVNFKPNVTSADPDFIETRIPNDGIYATSYLDPHDFISRKISTYGAGMYEYLEKRGYVRYKNMDAVAYDWRQSPYNFFEEGDYFDRLKRRVETMYKMNGNTKVTLVGHSMGGATGALFLSSYVDEDWKATYIEQFISVAGVFGGSVKALAAATTTTDSFLTHIIPEFAALAKHIPGLNSMVPISNKAFPLWKNATIFTIGSETFTTDDLPKIYEKFQSDEYIHVIDAIRDIGYEKPPGAKVHCLMTLTLPTTISISVKSLDPKDVLNAELIKGHGDGIVPAKSLKHCEAWRTMQKQPVVTKEFSSEHQHMLSSDTTVWEYIYRALIINSNAKDEQTL